MKKILALVCFIAISQAQAQQGPPPQQNTDTSPPAGSYTTAPRSDGSFNRIYTTGQKQPYIVDAPSANSYSVEPNVYGGGWQGSNNPPGPPRH